MKFNINKIAQIKNADEIKKLNPNKPLFYSNYLFHYLIMFGKLDLLKLHKHPIYKFNEENLNGFMVAAKYSNYDILEYLLKEYQDYAQMHNEAGLNFINYIDNPSKLIQLMKKFEKIDWEYLFKFKNETNIEFYRIFLKNLNKVDFEWFIKTYTNFNVYYIISSIIYNKKLSDKDKIDILDTFTDEELDSKGYGGDGILFDIIEIQNPLFAKYFIKRNVDLEYIWDTITPLYGLLYLILNEDKKNANLETILEIVWDKVKLKINYNFTNRFGINYVQLILMQLNFSTRKSTIVSNIIDYILTNSPDSSWNHININKTNSLNMLIELPVDKYAKYIKNRSLSITKDLLASASPEWVKVLDKVTVYKPNINVKLEELPYQHNTNFSAGMHDIIIYFIYLDKKYKQLYIPNMPDHANLRDDLFPYVITYSNENINIHPDLNININKVRRENKHDYSLVFLSLYDSIHDLRHANIILYDFKRLTVERFEPYGNIGSDIEMDEILEEELTWNTGFKYLKPCDYLPSPGFQELANENSMENLKSGDFGGFCLGWCIWYVEHRLRNKMDPKILTTKTLEKMLRTDYSLVEFIRNYSNKLYDEKNKLLIKHCPDINEKELTDTHPKLVMLDKITKFAKEYFGINE